MSKRTQAALKEQNLDPVYNSKLIGQAINCIMWDGKKNLAESLMYEALDIVKEKLNEEPAEIFDAALKNVMTVLEVRSRRVGGSTYQVPIEVSPNRRVALGLRWIVHSARKRGERKMSERLAGEILDAYKNEGSAVRKKEDTHRMAEANKLFAHYRW